MGELNNAAIEFVFLKHMFPIEIVMNELKLVKLKLSKAKRLIKIPRFSCIFQPK